MADQPAPNTQQLAAAQSQLADAIAGGMVKAGVAPAEAQKLAIGMLDLAVKAARDQGVPLGMGKVSDADLARLMLSALPG